MFVSFLIGDLEYFILSNRNEINTYIQKNESIPYEKSLLILNKFAETLEKTSQLINYIEEIKDKNILRDMFIISSESLAWILFTLPSISEKLPIFPEELNINGQSIYDVIGNNLIQIEMLIDNPDISPFVAKNLKENIHEISMAIGHIVKMMDKSKERN
ncbi:MAG TPA: hypothetical protein EYH43_04590 [Persephonella sp.]|nr:hypothetical protein [Hydrogenothermaceae bacterium]HIQ25243.1 hypothetical protein [Persephonella sp.]